MFILFHFTLTLLKLEHSLIIADLHNQNPTKRVVLLYKNNVLIRCYKWISSYTIGISSSLKASDILGVNFLLNVLLLG